MSRHQGDDPTQHDAERVELYARSVETITPPSMTPEQKDAFRAYMHNLNRQAAIAQGVDPDTICPQCGEDLPHDHTDPEC